MVDSKVFGSCWAIGVALAQGDIHVLHSCVSNWCYLCELGWLFKLTLITSLNMIKYLAIIKHLMLYSTREFFLPCTVI